MGGNSSYQNTGQTPLTCACCMVALVEPGSESPRDSDILPLDYITADFEIWFMLCFDMALAPRSQNITVFLSADFYETQLVKS